MKREQDEINGLVIWIGSGDRFDVDLEHPIPVVKRILEPRLEFQSKVRSMHNCSLSK